MEVLRGVVADVEHGELGGACGDVIGLQILLHNRRVRALRQLSPLLDATVAKNTGGSELVGSELLTLLRARHLKLLERRLCKLFLDFPFELDELHFYLRIYVPFPLQRPTSKCNDVALRGAGFATNVLLSVSYSLADAVHVVRLVQTILTVSAGWLTCVELMLLLFLRTLHAPVEILHHGFRNKFRRCLAAC